MGGPKIATPSWPGVHDGLALFLSSLTVASLRYLSNSFLYTATPLPGLFHLLENAIEYATVLALNAEHVYVEVGVGKRLKSHALRVPASGGDSARSLVLLHGLSSKGNDLGLLAWCIKRQSRAFKDIIIIDLMGHGRSEMIPRDVTLMSNTMSDSVVEMLVHFFPDARERDRVVICGNSLGGWMGHKLGVQGLPNPLYLLNPGGAHQTDQELVELREAFEIGTQKESVEFVDRISGSITVLPWFMRQFLAFGVRHRTASINVRRVFDMIQTTPQPAEDDAAVFSKWIAPVGIFWGKDEKLLPNRNFEYFTTLLPKDKLLAVEQPDGYGHVPHNDNPMEVSRCLDRFVKLLDPGQ
jgi:pimeloyl-ACP methyl ester carboxylesterase